MGKQESAPDHVRVSKRANDAGHAAGLMVIELETFPVVISLIFLQEIHSLSCVTFPQMIRISTHALTFNASFSRQLFTSQHAW